MSNKARRKNGQSIFVLSESLTKRFQASCPSALAGKESSQEEVERTLAFRGTAKNQWGVWRKQLLAELKKCTGAFPEKTPLNARIIEKKVFPSYIREKVVFDSEKYMSVPVWVCSPKNKKPGEKFPAVLCSPGDGPGKDPLVGLYNGAECLEYHKLVAIQFAERGYVSIIPDWRLFGERAEPIKADGSPGDAFNLIRLAEKHFGFTLMGLNVWDGMRTLDYLVTREDVAPDRIGCLGVFLGSSIAAFLALYDRRITALALSGYLGTEKGKIFVGGWPGRQEEFSPDFHKKIAAAEDVAGLLAPLPLLMQGGEYDTMMPSDKEKPFAQVKKIYQAAGAADLLTWDFFEGSTEINVPPIMGFFDQYLCGCGREGAGGRRPAKERLSFSQRLQQQLSLSRCRNHGLI